MTNVGRHNGKMQFSTVMAVTILLGSRSLFTNLTPWLCLGQIISYCENYSKKMPFSLKKFGAYSRINEAKD